MKIFLIVILILLHVEAKTQNVSLVLTWKHQFQFAGYYIAKQKGFYEELGLHVDIKEYDLQRDNTKEVSLGKFDFGVGHSSLILDKINRYPNIVMLNAINQSSPLILLAKKRPDIEDIEDIKNKKIMMGFDQTYTASINAMLSSGNFSQDSYKIIPTSFNPIDLINGNADLMVAYSSNEPFALEQKGVEYTIFDPKEYGYDFYSDILFTSKELSQNDPKLVDDFYKATMKGWLYAYEHVEESVDIIFENYNTQHKSKKALFFEAKTLKKLALADGIKLGDIDPLRLKEMISTYRLLGLVKTKTKIDYNDFIYYPLSKKNNSLTNSEKEYLVGKKELNICVIKDNMPHIGIDKDEIVGMFADFNFKDTMDISFKATHVINEKEAIAFLKAKKCDILPAYKEQSNSDKSLYVTNAYMDIPLVIKKNKSYGYSFKDMELNYNINKKIPIHMLLRAEDKILIHIIEKEINLIDQSTKYSVLNNWINAKYIKSVDYKLLWIFLFVILFIGVFSYFTKVRLDRLLTQKTKELEVQLNIFDKHVCASRTDTKGIITYASEAFCKKTGYSKEELLGKTHSLLRDKETPCEIYQDLWMSIACGHAWSGKLKNCKKDRTLYWVSIVISPIFEKDSIVGYSSIREDITLQKELKE